MHRPGSVRHVGEPGYMPGRWPRVQASKHQATFAICLADKEWQGDGPEASETLEIDVGTDYEMLSIVFCSNED